MKGSQKLYKLLNDTLKLYLPFILGLFILLWLSLFLYQQHLQNQVKQQTDVVSPNGINTLEKITLRRRRAMDPHAQLGCRESGTVISAWRTRRAAISGCAKDWRQGKIWNSISL